MKKPPKLPPLLERKLYKTGQTRGADDDVIYQNRVSRESTVLIPYSVWDLASKPPEGEDGFTYGAIALVSPRDYFGQANIEDRLAARGLSVGTNALIFYETRDHWNQHNPVSLGLEIAQRRRPPLGGQYVARVPGNTAFEGGKILHGFTTTANKGAGIRAYEYASASTITKCRFQLEALFWLCFDSEQVAVANGMTTKDVQVRKSASLNVCEKSGLLSEAKLRGARIINTAGHTVCPLCLEELTSEGFLNRLTQAEGREVSDLTVTQLNLFHIQELRYGVYNHRPYNVGWGHHHCNVVVKDAGLIATLDWMDGVLKKNVSLGYLASSKKGS